VGRSLELLGSFLLGPLEPMVHMSVGGQPIDFMVDTGTKHLVATLRVAPISK
jgi:hypothetical protein